MNVPAAKGTPAAFLQAIVDWLRENCRETQDGFLCKTCNTEIQGYTVFVSVHYEIKELCAGAGECKQRQVPYCPRCEPAPGEAAIRTCVHVPFGEDWESMTRPGRGPALRLAPPATADPLALDDAPPATADPLALDDAPPTFADQRDAPNTPRTVAQWGCVLLLALVAVFLFADLLAIHVLSGP